MRKQFKDQLMILNVFYHLILNFIPYCDSVGSLKLFGTRPKCGKGVETKINNSSRKFSQTFTDFLITIAGLQSPRTTKIVFSLCIKSFWSIQKKYQGRWNLECVRRVSWDSEVIWPLAGEEPDIYVCTI